MHQVYYPRAAAEGRFPVLYTRSCPYIICNDVSSRANYYFLVSKTARRIVHSVMAVSTQRLLEWQAVMHLTARKADRLTKVSRFHAAVLRSHHAKRTIVVFMYSATHD